MGAEDPAAFRWDVPALAVDGAAEISAMIRIRSDAPDHLEAVARIAFAEQIDPTKNDRSASAALNVVDLPPPPDLTGPGVVPFDGEQDVDLSVTLRWPDVPDADRYRLVLTGGTGTSKTDVIVDVDTLTVPSFALENLQPMHVYTWRVASISEGGQGMTWQADVQSSGIYFVRMRAGSFTAVRRLLLVK